MWQCHFAGRRNLAIGDLERDALQRNRKVPMYLPDISPMPFHLYYLLTRYLLELIA